MESKYRALLVEDDNDVCELVRIILRSEGFAVDIAQDGPGGLEMALHKPYTIIILDVMLPGIDGWEICRTIRSRGEYSRVPIIMLTAKVEESEKVYGLELGADDYVSKPFSPRELLARIKAVLRRSDSHEQDSRILTKGPLTIDLQKYEATVEDRELFLTPKEFELLATLLRHHGQTMNRRQLLEINWGYDFIGDDRTVDEHIKRLRKKLKEKDPDRQYIQTIWGVGYKFEIHEKTE